MFDCRYCGCYTRLRPCCSSVECTRRNRLGKSSPKKFNSLAVATGSSSNHRNIISSSALQSPGVTERSENDWCVVNDSADHSDLVYHDAG